MAITVAGTLTVQQLHSNKNDFRASLRWVVCWDNGQPKPRKIVEIRSYPEIESEWGEIYSAVLFLRGAITTCEKRLIVLARRDDCLVTVLDDDDLPWMTVAIDRDAGLIPGTAHRVA